MHIKLNILNSFSRKACYIIFTLFISISFSFGGALANSCKGGADCLNCAELAHLHVPGAETGMENHGCRPVGQNSDCGFEDYRIPDHQVFLVSAFRVDNHEGSSIPVFVADDYIKDSLSKGFITPIHFSVITTYRPIYLLNLSLLC